MTTTRKLRRRIAAGTAAFFVAVFSVLWTQAPATPTPTAQRQVVAHHGKTTTITTRTSGGRTITTVVNANGVPQSSTVSSPAGQAEQDS